MTTTIDPLSDRAVYKQIADHLRQEIQDGTYGAGEQLPSEAELVRRYDVSRLTVRRALGILAGEGLTVSAHGRGVFVRGRPPVRRLASDRFARHHREKGKAAFMVEMEQAGMQMESQVLEIARRAAPAEIASLLGISTRQEVIVRRRRYLGDGYPLEIATSYIPVDVGGGTAVEEENPGPGGIYARIEEAGFELTRFTETIRVRVAEDSEVRALGLSAGAPVMRLVRTAYSGDKIVEVCDTVMNAVAFELAYELPAS